MNRRLLTLVAIIMLAALGGGQAGADAEDDANPRTPPPRAAARDGIRGLVRRAPSLGVLPAGGREPLHGLHGRVDAAGTVGEGLVAAGAERPRSPAPGAVTDRPRRHGAVLFAAGLLRGGTESVLSDAGRVRGVCEDAAPRPRHRGPGGGDRRRPGRRHRSVPHPVTDRSFARSGERSLDRFRRSARPFTFGVFGGFGLFIEPLPPGEHVLHARTTARRGASHFDITYAITVTTDPR